MSKTIRLTMAQALVRYLAAIKIEDEDGSWHDFVGGTWAIFGHGNVCGLGEALSEFKDADSTRSLRPDGFPVFRGHNEQGMAHAAIAYAKANMRRRMMTVTTSIGPGATNLVTAAGLAHVNRLPVLLLPGDIFNDRGPDPVLQQTEDFASGDMNVNDCLRPVSRYFDRITDPAQLLTALPRAMAVLTDPVMCGPVTLALPQDVQAQAFDYPEAFFNPEPLRIRRSSADERDINDAIALIKKAKRPLVISGGGVLYSGAEKVLDKLIRKNAISGSAAANELARNADLVIAIGTRMQDFTSGSNALFTQADVLALNVSPLDATRLRAKVVLGDARLSLEKLLAEDFSHIDSDWCKQSATLADKWRARVDELTTHNPDGLPYDAEVIGAVRDSIENSPENDIVVCAAGTLPAELHKLWRADGVGNYHMDYGYSCMGYEIAGSLGVKMARPEKEVIVMVGDGSYLMLNSEIASAQMLGLKLIIVVQDNHGYGCINRLQRASGSPNYNNLLAHCVPENGEDVFVDFAMHARSLGAYGENVATVDDLKQAMKKARKRSGVSVLVIKTTPEKTTEDGGIWWEVGIPEVSNYEAVNQAYSQGLQEKAKQRK